MKNISNLQVKQLSISLLSTFPSNLSKVIDNTNIFCKYQFKLNCVNKSNIHINLILINESTFQTINNNLTNLLRGQYDVNKKSCAYNLSDSNFN